MSDSVGKISLDLELQSDLSRQIEAAAGKIGEQIKASLKNIGNFDFKAMADSMSNAIKRSIDESMKAVQTSIEKTLNKAIAGAVSTSKNIKVPVNFDIPKNSPTPKISTGGTATKPRAPPIPKINAGLNIEAVKSQIDNLTASLDISNAKIEQQKAKLAQLKEEYSTAFSQSRKNKLEEQILKTEASINKLIATSDKAGFKLADLDEQFRLLSGSTKEAMAGVNAVNNKLKGTANAANKSSNGLKLLGNSTKDSGKKFDNSRNQMNMFFSSLFKWGLVFPMVIGGITATARFLGQSLMANAQFANSLNQVRSNLYTAFMPIYQAVLPAINALMAGLSRITAYIAMFTNALFGKTFQQSFGAAKGLIAAKTAMGAYGEAAKKAGKDANGALAGFDEINTLNMGNNQDTSGGAGSSKVPQMVMPEIDTTPSNKLLAIADKFKGVLGTIFQPFKNAWVAVGPSVTAEFNKAIEGSKATLNNFFNMLATPPVQAFLENVGKLGLSIIKLGLKIYDGFILPVVNWFIGLLPGAASGLNPILDTITKIVNYLSGDGFPIVQFVLSSIIGLIIGIKAFQIGTSIVTLLGKIKTIGPTLGELWAVLIANPIVLVIALVAGLAFAFGVLYASNESFRNKVNEVGKTISNFFAPILKALKETFLDIWNNALVPLGKVLEELGSMIITPLAKIFKDIFAVAIKFVADVAKDLWNLVLVPLGSFVKDIFIKIIQSAIEIFHDWKPAIQVVIDVIMFLWTNVLKPLMSFLSGVFIGVFHGVFTTIGDLIGGIKQIFSGIIDFITGVFTGNWRRAWEGVKEVFSGIVGTLGAVMKAPLNAVIGLINGAIKSINKIKVPEIDLPFGMGTVGGWKFNIPNIPYLAKGGVIDQPTLAMVGERGKEAVMPLENNTGWITQLAGQIAAILGANQGQNNNITTDRPIEIVIQLGGYEFARFIIDSINALQRKTGKTLLEV